MVLVYSATKRLAAMTLAVAHSRGWLDYEERVSIYWPEFIQQGKEAITVRQLLAHRAGQSATFLHGSLVVLFIIGIVLSCMAVVRADK